MMEIFQTIWNAITTPNEILINIFGFFSCFIEALVNMLLFTTILDIPTTKKQKILYVIIFSILAIILRTFIVDPLGSILNLIASFLLIKFLLKTTVLKALIAVFIPIILSVILELILLNCCTIIFKANYDSLSTIPLYRVLFTCGIYLCIYIIYRIIRYFKFNINIENLNRRSKILFIINALFGILAMSTQFFLIIFYSDTMPASIILINILSLFAYFFISIYSLLNTAKLETTSQNLEEAQLYNKTLILLHDSMRGFKHDFHNIVQGIGGYIETENLEGLEK